jgi:hypothetical protein
MAEPDALVAAGQQIDAGEGGRFGGGHDVEAFYKTDRLMP